MHVWWLITVFARNGHLKGRDEENLEGRQS